MWIHKDKQHCLCKTISYLAELALIRYNDIKSSKEEKPSLEMYSIWGASSLILCEHLINSNMGQHTEYLIIAQFHMQCAWARSYIVAQVGNMKIVLFILSSDNGFDITASGYIITNVTCMLWHVGMTRLRSSKFIVIWYKWINIQHDPEENINIITWLTLRENIIKFY